MCFYSIETDPINPVGTRYTFQERIGIIVFVVLLWDFVAASQFDGTFGKAWFWNLL